MSPTPEKEMETVTVNANALRQLLTALMGPPHLIRELQFTRDIPPFITGNPIDQLIDEYNKAVREDNEQDTDDGMCPETSCDICKEKSACDKESQAGESSTGEAS